MEPENVESPKPVVNPKNQVSAAKIYRLAIHRMPNWPNDFCPNAQVNDKHKNLKWEENLVGELFTKVFPLL